MQNIKSTMKNLISCKVKKTRSKRFCEATTFSKAGSTSAPHWPNPAELGTVRLTLSQLEGINPNFLKSLRSFSFRLGDVEALREAMPGRGLDLEAGRLYWLTDRC